jgi:subfamily B ATP-binding cassette protein HlyB/CyaB
MNNELTVGQFVAFNMFAQRVAQPIMRMAQLWTDFQQTGISMARLGDILNTRTEVPPTSRAAAAHQGPRHLDGVASATAPMPRCSTA